MQEFAVWRTKHCQTGAHLVVMKIGVYKCGDGVRHRRMGATAPFRPGHPKIGQFAGSKKPLNGSSGLHLGYLQTFGQGIMRRFSNRHALETVWSLTLVYLAAWSA